MFQLNDLAVTTKKRKRVGRGGGRGGTSGKGHKGQKARTGSSAELRPFFEGGQMPLARRVPRRGFTNVSKKEFNLINLELIEAHFQVGDVVDKAALRARGLIKGRESELLKVLGDGTLTKQLTVVADAFSQTARAAIEQVKGVAQLIAD